MIKVPTLFGWMVLIRGEALLTEWRTAPGTLLSGQDAKADVLQMMYTMDPRVVHDGLHLRLARHQLAKATPDLVHLLNEEVVAALKDYIATLPTDSDGWSEFAPHNTVSKIVARASNRMLIGLLLCCNADFIQLSTNYMFEVLRTSTLLRMLPLGARRLVNWFSPMMDPYVAQASKYIVPVIRERREKMAFLNDQYVKPFDLLMWLVDEAEAQGRHTDERILVIYILMFNFIAIHTTSITMSNLISDIAERQECQAILREEARMVTGEFGWGKDALDKLVKLDSFVKESMRLRPIASIMLERFVKQDYTFSNGTTLPEGTLWTLPTRTASTLTQTSLNPGAFAISTKKQAGLPLRLPQA
ncbi:cytochrome P450 [Coprinopsis marcescibilis]|uniref:Cytochrome P450 n=1 Tax=Coprinopsis marcescibilis TaxID=230819 RepID=A0A5C3L108_COPMA|nr:cytochrome P450 [Coprinopsis marcescibilis]